MDAQATESGKARDIPLDEMAQIVADLRTLAATADFGPESRSAKELALRIDQRLGRINGRYAMEERGLEILHRELDDDELPLAAAMSATLDLLLWVQLGTAPTDCGTRLRTLADELETRFKALSGTPGNGAEPTEPTWEVPWDEDNRDFIQSGQARVKYTNARLPGSTLSEKLGAIPVHFMRRTGKGARVHERDFEAWARQEYPQAFVTDEERQEIADEVAADREAMKQSLRRK